MVKCSSFGITVLFRLFVRTFFQNPLKLWCLLAGIIALGACSTQSPNLDDYSEQGLYDRAQENLKKRYWTLSIELLRRLEADYPFGQYSEPAQLSLIYAYYQSDEPELADAAANRFIRLHPQHPDVDYAWYMRGLSAFPEPGSFFQSMFGSDLSRKSMENAEQSLLYFGRLSTEYPQSKYTADALKRMEYLRNLIAQHEVNVANFYLDYQAYAAAISRARYVVENFQQSPAMPDALAILVHSYNALGLEASELKSLEVLTLNYPDYPALNEDGAFNYDYVEQQGFSVIPWLTFGLLGNNSPPGFNTKNDF